MRAPRPPGGGDAETGLAAGVRAELQETKYFCTQKFLYLENELYL